MGDHATNDEIKIEECLQDSKWDTFVSGTPQNNVFSKSPWIRSICEVTDLSFRLITCVKGGETVGGCPLFLRKRKTGLDVVVPPLTQYSTPCLIFRPVAEKYRNEQHVLAVTKAIAEYIGKTFDRATLICHPNLLDIRSFLWSKWASSARYTYLLDLTDMRRVKEQSSRDIARQFRKAEKAGFYVKQSGQFEEFVSMWKASLSRQSATIPLTEGSLVRLLHVLTDKGCRSELHLAYDSAGDLVAGNVFLIDGDQAFYWLGGARPDYLSSGANQLVFWQVLDHLHQERVRRVDFVGADHPSIARYKSTFGGDLCPHFVVAKTSSKTRGLDLLSRVTGLRRLLR